MKKWTEVAGLVAIALAVASPSLAQTLTDDVEMARSVIQTERKKIVIDNMEFTEEESAAFWPVYNKFHEDLRKVNDRRATLIRQLSEEFETLTEKRAKELLKEYLDFQEERTKLRKKYLRDFSKVLPGKKVVRYYQIENKVDAVLDFSLARAIPLVR